MNQLKKWLIYTTIIQFVFTSAVFSNSKSDVININYQSADGAYVLFWDCNYRTAAPTLYINITEVTGGSGNYTITTAANTFVSQSSITGGEGFTFYFTEAAQLADDVTFTISDTQGNSCKIDFYIETQLYFLDIGNCAQPNFICKENITHYSGMIPVTDHNAVDTIFSSGTVQSSTSIKYFAGDIIDLQPGFEVKADADFIALIQNCQ